ncbi:hypothetical protein T09_9571 [Trichinella sp. T9]|nr:hypothetical protein T09_4884 [Trichinella sp. T9]KRX51914.1 hypothetical protein T09_9571 [Trichinella sp. T9]
MLSMTLWKHATPFVTPNGTMIDGTEETRDSRIGKGLGFWLTLDRRWLRELLVRKKRQSDLNVVVRAVILVPLIVASTMAFFNSVAVGEEELINDVTETEAVRLDAVLHTFAK